MTASALGRRRATVARGTKRAHVITVSPHIRSDGTKHPNAFEARLAGALLCVSETPLLDAARALLARGIAAPEDTIVMRHVGSHVDALRARVGVAAGLVGRGPAERKSRPTPREVPPMRHGAAQDRAKAAAATLGSLMRTNRILGRTVQRGGPQPTAT